MKLNLLLFPSLVFLFQFVSPIKAQVNQATKDAVNDYVVTCKDFLNILIGKAGLFQVVPFIGQPVADNLRQFESTSDTLCFTIIDKPCLNQDLIQVNGLKALTQKCKNLQTPAKGITIINGPLILIGQGPFPEIIQGLQDLVKAESALVARIHGSTPTQECAPDSDVLPQLASSLSETLDLAIKQYQGLSGLEV